MKNTRENIITYYSISDFLAGCETPPNETWKDARRSSRENSDSWTGCSYEKAKEFALYGWEKGLERISAKLIQTVRKGTTRQTVKSVAGHTPDVARYVAGLPDCMNMYRMAESNSKRCLTIVLNTSYSARVNPEEIINYGTAIATLIDDLETARYSVTLTIGAISTTNYTQRDQGYLIDVKSEGQALDLGKLAYFIAHPSQLRRLGFSHWEGHCDEKEMGFGYGTICDLPKALRGDLYFGQQSDLSHCNTPASAMKFVQGIVNKQMPGLLETDSQAA